MSEQAKPCNDPKASQFDFWVGECDLTWGEDHHGTNTIRKAYNGCVIYEDFNGAPAMEFRGMSVSVYDPALGKWRQTWVDEQGSYLDLSGEFKDGEMVLACKSLIEGHWLDYRMVFSNIEPDSLVWRWERSEDEGQNWQPIWEIHYQRCVI